jgi:hypothetical protein
MHDYITHVAADLTVNGIMLTVSGLILWLTRRR